MSLSDKSDQPIWKYRIKFVLNYDTHVSDVIEGRLQKIEEPNVADANIKNKYEKRLKRF